MQKKTVNF